MLDYSVVVKTQRSLRCFLPEKRNGGLAHSKLGAEHEVIKLITLLAFNLSSTCHRH